LKFRHSLVVFALVPMLMFSLFPLAVMSPAFEGPASASGWVA